MNSSGIDANKPLTYRSSGPPRDYLKRYALAALSVGVALWASLLLEYFHFRVPSALLMLSAVAISSWYAGLGPAVLAFVLSTIGFYWYFVEPVRTIYINRSEIPYFLIFVGFAALLSWFGSIRRRGEEELREQAALLNLTNDTVLVMDMEGVIKYWNRGAEERYGWSSDEAVGRVVHDLLKTVFPVPLEEIKAELVREGHWEGELVHTTKDATELVVASRWALQRDKKGTPVAILETNNDVTELKRSAKALRRLNRRAMLRSRVSSLSPARIAFGYAGISILWIAFSDSVVTRLNLPPVVMTIKGILFVFVTAALLYFTIRRLVRFVQLTSQERDETARLYRTVVDASNEGICLLDESGRLSFLNDRLAAMLGRRAEELVGKRFQDFVEEPEALAERGGQHSNTRECRLRTDSDDKPWVLFSRHAVLNDVGEVVQLVGTVIDITERKHAEEALRRLNRELQAISNCNQVLLRATDEQGLLQEVCRIVCEEAGYPMAWASYVEHDEAKSMRPVAWAGADEEYFVNARISWSEDSDHGRGPTGVAVRSGNSSWIQDFATDVRVAPWRETLLQSGSRAAIALPLKDEQANVFGTLTIHSAQPNAFTPEEVRLLDELAGDLAFGIVTLRSRAARKKAEQEVALMSFALDKVSDAAFLTDERGRFRYVNEEACRVLGLERAELLNLGVEDIDTEFQPGRWSDHWRDLKAQGKLSFESRHRMQDGRIFPVEISANYFEYGGREYNLALARDITERKQVEEKLRQQEQALRQVLDFMPDLVAEFDSDRKRLYANRPTLEYFGVSLEEWKSITDPYQFYHPDDRERISRYAYTGRETPHEFEARFRKSDGTYRWFLFRDNPVRDENGRITRWYFAATEIEDRKQAEEALRRSEAYLAEAERIGHTGTWVWNPAGGIQYWSKECYTIMGFDPAEGLPGLERFLEAVHPEDLERLRERLQEVAGEKTSYETEYRIIRPSGEVRNLRVIGHPVLDSAGNLLEYIGTSADVTERKRAEEALRRTEGYLVEAQRLTHTGAWATDAEPKPLYWSEELFRLYGLDSRKGVPPHETAVQRVHPEDRERYVQAFARVIHEKVDTDVEFRTILPDGTIKHLYGLGHPVLGANGEVVEVVGTTVDITERKSAEEERMRLRRLEADLAHINRVSVMGELTASIAHEINQPLAGIVSSGSACLRWLARDVPDLAEAREAARRIVRDGKRAGEIITRIRALTKKAETSREKLNLNETIRQVLALVGDEAKKNNVDIRTQFGDDVLPVRGDQVQLQQVVLNLAVNAIEAMSKADWARELIVTTRNIDANRVQVTIEDSGIGIAPEVMDKIFESFYTTKAGGMGMGLSICRSIIQAHGGRLWATARNGGGTVFYFTLPQYHEEESDAGIATV